MQKEGKEAFCDHIYLRRFANNTRKSLYWKIVSFICCHRKRYVQDIQREKMRESWSLRRIKWKAMYHMKSKKTFYWIRFFFSSFHFPISGEEFFAIARVIEGAYYIANYKRKAAKLLQDTREEKHRRIQ